jgi:hypothetical protein
MGCPQGRLEFSAIKIVEHAMDLQKIAQSLPIVEHPEILETFADTIGSTFFDGSTLRLDFTVARWDDPKPPAEPTGHRHVVCRLVLSAPCAIELINRMQQISAALVQAGIMKKEQQPKPRMN